jgi:hypothetical protein
MMNARLHSRLWGKKIEKHLSARRFRPDLLRQFTPLNVFTVLYTIVADLIQQTKSSEGAGFAFTVQYVHKPAAI